MKTTRHHPGHHPDTDSFRVIPLPAPELERIRRQGHDDHGNPLRPITDLEGGAPLRCCLRDSTAGERIALIAWSPFHQSGPYAEVGPVYIHADRCNGYPDTHAYPNRFRRRHQVFRAYNADGHILGGVVAKPDERQERRLAELFADPEVAFVHSRNVIYGCYMFEIRRA